MTLLEIEAVEYGAIESEQLALGSPLLAANQWTPQLDAVLSLQRQAGRRVFLIAATAEDADELDGVVSATHAERVLVVCLSAAPAIVAARLAAREPDRWPGKQRLIAHARALAESMPRLDGVDLVVETETRDAETVARQVRDAMKVGDLLSAGRT